MCAVQSTQNNKKREIYNAINLNILYTDGKAQFVNGKSMLESKWN